MSHFVIVRVAEVYFFNSYKDYIYNTSPDEHFTVFDEEINNMDDVIHEIFYRRIVERKLNYFKIVEGYKFVEDENNEQE